MQTYARQVLYKELTAAGRSVTEISAALTDEELPV